MSATIEIVTFKLTTNASEKAFLAASPKVDIWAKQQEGFEYRALSKKHL